MNRIGETIAEAFALARQGRPGPVLVDIPNDVLKARTDVTALCEPLTYGGAGPRVSDAAVRDAVDVLYQAYFTAYLVLNTINGLEALM